MREGENPEKKKNLKNVLKKHRVIVVYYIPNNTDSYFKGMLDVLDLCLTSLIKTINHETTNITLIDNNSFDKTEKIINKYSSYIDKHVIYNENKGKVYAVLNEVRGVYEEFVTITDADILFFDGWEKEVFNIYKDFPHAGVVSPYPCPYLTFYYNKSVFGFNSLLGKIKYGKYVEDEDINLYLKGTSLPKLIDRRSKQFNWREKQFLFRNNNKNAIVGAYHVVATYRIEQFRGDYSFPKFKFINSYEEFFIDSLSDKLGAYRLSTIKSYIYHIGNKLDTIAKNHNNKGADFVSKEIFNQIENYRKINKYWILLNTIIARIFIKFKWNNK